MTYDFKRAFMQSIVYFCLLWGCIIDSNAQTDTSKFKVIGFYAANWDGAHISFAHEANAWFPEMAKKYNFTYDSTNNWNNLNESFLSQYQVVLFLDNAPGDAKQRAAFQKYIQDGGSWLGFHVVAFNQDPMAWDWYYNKFLGMGSYKNNTWAPSPAVLRVEDKTCPATQNLPDTFRTAPNEWYSWMVDLRTKSNIKILCSIDPTSFPLGDGSGNGGASEIWHSGYYPVVWTNTDYHMLYINMGHNRVDYGKNNKTLSWTFKNEFVSKLTLDALFWLADLNKPDPMATKISVVSPKNGTTYKEHDNIDIEITATDSNGVAKVQFFNATELLGTDSIAPYQLTIENVELGTYDITVKVTDSVGNIVSSWVSFNVQGEGPYNKKMAEIPGKVEVENFDYGGQEVGYNDADVSNQGGQYRTAEGVDIEECSDAGAGYNIGYTSAGEWLKYTVNVTQSGYYTLQARVAATSSGKSFHVEMDGTNISGSIKVPNSGGWQVWKTVNVAIPDITAGQKTMRIIMDTDGFNLNYINFTQEPVSIEENLLNDEFIYPNPSNGVVHINLKNQGNTIKVYDNLGREVKSFQLKKANVCINLTDIEKGIYFVKIGNNSFQKLIRN